MEKPLPSIPAKRYFTIGEVSELCGVKPYVLRYWEQEFSQLKPMKRRGNRRYYQHHEVLLVRRIRELLYDQGFTISGARNRLQDGEPEAPANPAAGLVAGSRADGDDAVSAEAIARPPAGDAVDDGVAEAAPGATFRWGRRATDLPPSELLKAAGSEPALSSPPTAHQVRAELVSIRGLLTL
jgi:DNA-binding transcriptional MerR regulator